MITSLVIDPCLFSHHDNKWLDLLKNESSTMNLQLMISRIKERPGGQQKDLIAIVGLGCAVASLVVSILQLIKSDKAPASPVILVEECHTFLIRNGIPDCTLQYVSGFEHLLLQDGSPCIFSVSLPGHDLILLRIGRTTELLIVTPKDYDSRSLLP